MTAQQVWDEAIKQAKLFLRRKPIVDEMALNPFGVANYILYLQERNKYLEDQLTTNAKGDN